MTDLDRLRRWLAAAMDRDGDWPAASPWIRDAVTALPRDTFAPELLYDWDGHVYQPVERGTDPDRWAALLYDDPRAAAVTQTTGTLPSSSLSCQAVVARMLDTLHLEPGHRVLELGTGTGWNTALMAQRTPPGFITTVEVDQGLADTARRRLPHVRIHTGDGGDGWPPDAPYDRVISTYAVEHIPWPWIEQSRPGARIVTPWGRLGDLALTVADDGRSASGHVQGLAQFMAARDRLDRALDYRQIRAARPPESERTLHRDLAPLAEDLHLRFALRVALPELRIATDTDQDGVNAWLHDGHSSWAMLAATGHGTVEATQGGPRRLTDELEAAWEQWTGLGSPGLYDYGITVALGQQYAWAIDPQTGPRWPATGRQEQAA